MKAIKKVLFAGLWVMMLTGCAIIGTNDRELPTLAVMPFTGIGDKEGETLATLLVNQSEIQNNFTTILRSNILDTIKKKEQEFQRSNITDLDTITDMGKELNADFVVAGSVQSFKGQKLVFLNIIDIKTLQLISGNYQKFGNIEEIPTLLSEMSSRVVKAPKIKTQNMLALAVLPFMIPEGEASEQEAETLAQIAAVEIVNSGKYAVLPRTQAIKTAMKEQENQRELGDQSAMQSLGKAINAKYILAGQTGNVGTKRYFSMQIVNLEKGSLLKGTDEEYHDVKEGIELIPLLVKKVISGRMTEAQKQELIDQQKAEQQKQKQTKAEAEVKRGLAYADKKDYDRAIEAYDAALEIIPGYSQAVTNRQTAVNAKAAALDLLDSGNRYFNEKNYDQAIVQYNAALQIIPGLPQAITNRQNAVNAITEALDLLDSGNKYFTEKSYDQAIAQYDAVLRIIPSYSQAITNRQNAVNAKVKTEVEALLASGNRYLTEKNYDQAIAQYDAALRIIPGLPQAVTNRQQAVNAKQQQAEQERLAKAEAEVKRGLAYADKKDYDRAIEAYDAALRIIPGYSQAVTNRQNAVNAKAALDLLASGNRYLTEKNYDQAIAQYDAALRIVPGLPQAVTNRQQAADAKQKQAEQERLAKAETEVKRGLAYADKKDYDRAIEAYDAALRIVPGYSQAVTNRQTAVNAKAALDLLASGNRYLTAKDYDQAIAQYDAALRIVPGLPQAVTNRQQAADAKQQQAEQERLAKAEAEVKRGLAYADKKDYDRAIEAYDAALRIVPGYSQAVTNRQTAVNAKAEAEALLVNGNKYFNEKNYDQAIAQYDAALRIVPGLPQAVTNRQTAVNAKAEAEALLVNGNKYFNEKNYDQAIAQYDAALRIVPGLPQAVTNRQQAADAKQQQAEQERLAKAEAEVKRGLAYADKKDYDRAIEAYDAALRIFPGYSQAVTNRQTAVNAKQQQAKQEAAAALLAIGNRYLNEKNYDQAIAQYDAALQIVPDYSQAITNRQQAADAKQKQAEQERLAKAEAEVKRGLAYADKKDYDRAIAAYDAALRIFPDYSQAVTNRQTAINAKAEAEALLVNGNRYFNEKNYDQAIAQYDAALEIVPGFPQAVTNRQQAADAKQKQAEQERLAKAEAEVKRGLAYADKKDYDRAIAAYDAALRIFPDYSQAVTNRQNAVNAKAEAEALLVNGNKYFNEKNYDQAIAQYDAALRIFPGLPQAITNRQQAADAKQKQAEQERLAEAEVKRGLAYADKKDYDRAIAAYDAALRIVPDYSQAVRNRQNAVSAKAEAEAEALLVNGNRYLTEKNYDQAIAQYDAALRIFPGLSQAVTNRQQAADAKQKQAEQERLAEAEVKRGLAYADKKDYDRAIAAYDAALRIFPDYSEAVRNRQNAENAKYDALFARGNAYFDAKEYDQAIAQYDAALRIFPGYSQALDKRQRAENAKQRK